MAKEPEKVRTGFYIEKEVLDRCDELLEQANAKSRNEFVIAEVLLRVFDLAEN